MDPTLYNLIVNCTYLVLNVICTVLLSVVYVKRGGTVVCLFATTTILSVITSGCNAFASTLRYLELRSEFKELAHLAFHTVTIVEPISILTFYTGLIVFSVSLLRKCKGAI